ncbi:MAG: hypothetical protein WD341_17195 [Tistlia sp.]|uniref:hypothetical protein n=1 Tax=Tistlia sp. TaxID=3057121 RepID=UPI0034A1B5C6
MGEKQKNEGEGNKSADRAYRKDTEDFIDSNDVEGKARDAAKDVRSPNQPLSPEEQAGRDRAKEFEPKDSAKK